MEHRIQLHQLRRTHLVPQDEADLRRLGRSLGLRADPVAELDRAWRRHATEVRRLHEKLFYRPLLDAVAQLEPGEARLSPDAARQRLEALGYADPAAALRHLEALASGVSRRRRSSARCCRCCSAGSPTPPTRTPGCSTSARSPTRWAAPPGTCGCCGTRARRPSNLARVLSAGRLAPDLLLRAPEAVALLGDPEALRPARAGGAASRRYWPPSAGRRTRRRR